MGLGDHPGAEARLGLGDESPEPSPLPIPRDQNPPPGSLVLAVSRQHRHLPPGRAGAAAKALTRRVPPARRKGGPWGAWKPQLGQGHRPPRSPERRGPAQATPGPPRVPGLSARFSPVPGPSPVPPASPGGRPPPAAPVHCPAWGRAARGAGARGPPGPGALLAPHPAQVPGAASPLRPRPTRAGKGCGPDVPAGRGAASKSRLPTASGADPASDRLPPGPAFGPPPSRTAGSGTKRGEGARREPPVRPGRAARGGANPGPRARPLRPALTAAPSGDPDRGGGAGNRTEMLEAPSSWHCPNHRGRFRNPGEG